MRYLCVLGWYYLQVAWGWVLVQVDNAVSFANYLRGEFYSVDRASCFSLLFGVGLFLALAGRAVG